MLNYARGIPVGNNQMPASYDAPPAVKAIARYLDENGAVSSVITLTQNTTAIEISTQGNAALMRWIASGDPEASVFGNASIMNFDHAIPPNTVRRFVVPVEGFQATGYSSQMGVNRQEGLYQRVAYATQGVASVAFSEYGSSNSY